MDRNFKKNRAPCTVLYVKKTYKLFYCKTKPKCLLNNFFKKISDPLYFSLHLFYRTRFFSNFLFSLFLPFKVNSFYVTCKLFQREKSKGKGFNDAAESLISQINKRYKPKDGTKSTRKLKESLIDRYVLKF